MRFAQLAFLFFLALCLPERSCAQTPLSEILRGKKLTQLRMENAPIPMQEDAVLFFGGLHGAEKFFDPRIFRHRDFLLLHNDTLSPFPLAYPGSGSIQNIGFYQDSVLYLGGGSDTNLARYSLADYWRYDFRSKEWKRLQDIPFRYTGRPNCFYTSGKDTLLVLLNGIYFENDTTYHYPMLFAYLPREDKWRELSGLPGTKFLHFIAFEDADNWYVLVNHGRFGVQPSGQLYSISKKDFKWTQRKDYPKKDRTVGYAFSENGYGYVGGGMIDGAFDNTLDRYDPATNSWTEVKTVYPIRHSPAWKYKGEWYNGFGATGKYFLEGRSTIRKIFPGLHR